MSLKVSIRHEAEIDIEEAATWYEGQRQGLGHEFLDEMLSLLPNNHRKAGYVSRCPQKHPPRLDSSISIWGLLSD